VPTPRLLTTDDWPEPELRAAVLAGELVPVGWCWASPAEPQDPALRARAFTWRVPDRRAAAALLTAAWIWGAVARPPDPVEVAVGLRVRVRADPGVRLREVQLGADDVVVTGGASVTTPERTALDLLRVPGTGAGEFDGVRAVAVSALVALGLVDVERLADRITALGTVPMARQAERRLRALPPLHVPELPGVGRGTDLR